MVSVARKVLGQPHRSRASVDIEHGSARFVRQNDKRKDQTEWKDEQNDTPLDSNINPERNAVYSGDDAVRAPKRLHGVGIHSY